MADVGVREMREEHPGEVLSRRHPCRREQEFLPLLRVTECREAEKGDDNVDGDDDECEHQGSWVGEP